MKEVMQVSEIIILKKCLKDHFNEMFSIEKNSLFEIHLTFKQLDI